MNEENKRRNQEELLIEIRSMCSDVDFTLEVIREATNTLAKIREVQGVVD